MANESCCRKFCIAFGSLIHAAFVAGVATFWIYWWINMRNIQNAAITICDNDTQPALRSICEKDIVVYDMYFLTKIDNRNYWSDYGEAREYFFDIKNDCDDDEDCLL